MSNDSRSVGKTKMLRIAIIIPEVTQMDLIKIGNFIAELRKKQKLTQEQLGEKLGVTNKTVSRWETGTYLPPAEALLAMSELFGVSINELLSGKRLSEAEYKEAAEENLKQTVRTSSFTLKDRIDFYKSKWLKEHRTIMILIGIGIVGVLLVGIILKNAWFVGTAFILLLLAHVWRNNTMMAYVEDNAFDGSGK